ncbi:MAG: hypothetical protein P8106_10345, partial [Gammaproteobacteria bacterium]
DDNGEVHYGDLPPEGSRAKAVDLPDYSRYAPRPLPSTESDAKAAMPAAAEPERVAPENYEVLRITRPEDNGTERSAEGVLNVQLAIVPALAEEHYVTFSLDGRQLGKRARGTSFDLTGVERGTHSLQARIVDDEGNQLAASDSVSFTMRQESLFLPGRAEPENPVAPPPSPGPIPATPGRTNPAFKPNYGG